jgi:hypothetical protein
MTIVAELQTALDSVLAELTQDVSVPEAPFEFGSDLSCISDIDNRATELAQNDPRIIWEYLCRRWTTRRGILGPDAPDWGIDAREWVNKGATLSQLAGYADQLRVEGEDDDRIASLEIVPSYTTQTRSLSFRVHVVTADPTTVDFDGTFALPQTGEVTATLDAPPLPDVTIS